MLSIGAMMVVKKLADKGVVVIMKTSVVKCGNSMGILLPNIVTETLDIHVYDQLELEIKNNKMILSKAMREVTIEELFKGYNNDSFQTDIQEFESEGFEKW